MKLLLLSSVFTVYISHAAKVVVEDRAFARQSNNVYFYSEIKELLSKWAVVDCLFGGTEFYQRYKSNKQKVKAYFQIKKYLEDRKFEINKSELASLVNNLRLKKCNVLDPLNNAVLLSGIKVEVFLQEMVLDTKNNSSKRAIKTLQKILDAKYPVFFYE